MSAERSRGEVSRTPVRRVDRRSALMGWLALIVLVVGGAAAAAKSLFSVRVPHGIPIGLSVRSRDSVFTLVRTMEPYVPSLHHDSSTERFKVALFVQPISGKGDPRMIPIAKGLKPGELHFPSVLGQEGDVVWCSLHDLFGVNLKTGRMIRSADVRAANPGLPEMWNDSRLLNFVDRLTVVSQDRRRSYAIDPTTLRATEVPVKLQGPGTFLTVKPEHFLSAGAMLSDTAWLGLASKEEASGNFDVGSTVKSVVTVNDRKVARQPYRARLGPGYSASVRRIEEVEAVSQDSLVNGAFVCTGAGQAPIRLSGPDGFVAIGAADTALGAKLVVVRVDSAGRVLWRRETELERYGLEQILPDDRVLGFVGHRPPVPGKVSEPLLVLVDLATGDVKNSTLWR